MTTSQSSKPISEKYVMNSPTATPSQDAFGLGTTQGQRSAEMVAAIRAELRPTPEARALTNVKGRIMAGVIMRLARSRLMLLNFIAARPVAFQVIIEKIIPKEQPDLRIVEVAAGLSPRGLYLARVLPKAQIIEVDLPTVVKEKQNRYRNAKIPLPENLSWRGADLGVTPLGTLLDNQKADIVVSEGLNQYFPPDQIQKIARHVYDTLKPGGAYVCDLSIEEYRKIAESEVGGAVSFFSKQAGKFAGILADEAAAKELLLGAGYERIEIFKASDITHSIPDVPKPVIDFSAIFVAYKKAE